MAKNEHDSISEQPLSYGTGRTSPPKSYGGIIAVLLVAVIFLGGIVSALSIMNIRLFRQLNRQAESGDLPKVLTPTQPTSATRETFDLSLQQAAPSVTGNDRVDLSLCQQAMDAVVSLSCRSDSGTVSGSGVVLSADGYILTNCHLLEQTISVQVHLHDGRTLTATVIGTDPATDLAVLHIPCTDLKAAQFGDSSYVDIGAPVAALGLLPEGDSRTLIKQATVSAIHPNLIAGIPLIQTDAEQTDGSTGGPILNCCGQVVGISSAKNSGYLPEGWAVIPSSTVEQVVEELIRQGYVSGRPALGFSCVTVDQLDQMIYDLPAGLYITQADPGTDSVNPGDVLLELDGEAVASTQALHRILYNHKIGDTVEALISRDGKTFTLSLTLGEEV